MNKRTYGLVALALFLSTVVAQAQTVVSVHQSFICGDTLEHLDGAPAIPFSMTSTCLSSNGIFSEVSTATSFIDYVEMRAHVEMVLTKEVGGFVQVINGPNIETRDRARNEFVVSGGTGSGTLLIPVTLTGFGLGTSPLTARAFLFLVAEDAVLGTVASQPVFTLENPMMFEVPFTFGTPIALTREFYTGVGTTVLGCDDFCTLSGAADFAAHIGEMTVLDSDRNAVSGAVVTTPDGFVYPGALPPVTVVPEPSTVILLATGLMALLVIPARRPRRRVASPEP